ncbi:hypothetical protein DO97_20660 [Neosynechococcus sphagnicola sy1]|uniref:Uncharacterized protein n=1 Tax=Neosynechococcus sphagnicola sy1 TaxID=1497020 RepID=A0A098TKP2_9CYAN|nr:hypothetical protein DO97_20660 [Neosynechococcus sphagnicola sy1]
MPQSLEAVTGPQKQIRRGGQGNGQDSQRMPSKAFLNRNPDDRLMPLFNQLAQTVDQLESEIATSES